MKTEGQINHMVKQRIFRHRKTYIKHGLARHPENCTFNDPVRLPVHMSNRAIIRVCGYCPEGSDPNNVVCDSTMGGERQAGECPYFEAHRSAEDLKKEFNDKIGIEEGTPQTRKYVEENYPDVAYLMWALGPSKKTNTQDPAQEDQNEILDLFGDEDETVTEDSDEPEPS